MAICLFSKQDLTAPLEPSIQLSSYEKIHLSFDRENLHFIDSQTGSRFAIDQ